jgi:hypothetical protein
MNLYNPYTPYVEQFTNSKEFSYLAQIYDETGFYTHLREDTHAYLDFWNDVRKKCIEGFTNSVGIRITGHHFFYLNFCRISGYNAKIGKKTEMFPNFMDLDYDYFHMVEYCEKNQKCLVALKGRRQGWSYKAAAICAWEFSFFPGSNSIIGTFLSSFGLETMRMTIENLNWLNTNTEFRKQRNPDLKDNIIARYQYDAGGVKVWKGYKSSVRAISFKDNPTAAVGKSASKLILDEAGVFPNITDTYSFTEPLIKAGSNYSGVTIMFGSSSDMDSGSRYFYEIFTNPGKYNMLEFDDDEITKLKVGYFSTAARGREGLCMNPKSIWFRKPMVDDEGNSNMEAATDDIMYEREKAKGGLDFKAHHGMITQFPLTWREGFLRDKSAVFASQDMLEWLSKLETIKELREDKKKIELYFNTDGKLVPKLTPDAQDITSFPLPKEESKKGCIVVWEDPEVNAPWGTYIAGCDPFDQDKADSSESLGSFIVYKRFWKAGTTHDIIVCEYTGRPDKADEFYENCRKICVYYNAKCLYENQLKGLKVYFEMKNSLHYLFEQPNIIKDIVKDSRVTRGYGIHMNRAGTTGTAVGIKDQCEIYLKQWLYEERKVDDKTMLNLHTIKSIPLLKELLAYDREVNTDRVIALMLCILQSKELHRLYLSESEPKTMLDAEPFWSRNLFKKNTNNYIRR